MHLTAKSVGQILTVYGVELRWWGGVLPPWAAESKGLQNGGEKKLNEAETDFLRSKKSLNVEPNTSKFNKLNFLKFVIPVTSGHCDYSPRASKKPSYATGEGEYY
jgi:hypothetical protein